MRKNEFNPEFPELFDWESLDGVALSCIGEYISDLIIADLKTEDRSKVQGLRSALNIVAEYAGIK